MNIKFVTFRRFKFKLMFYVKLHCVHEKNGLRKHILRSSKLASFAQLQINSINICLFSIKLPILVEICPTVNEILTFNQWP